MRDSGLGIIFCPIVRYTISDKAMIHTYEAEKELFVYIEGETKIFRPNFHMFSFENTTDQPVQLLQSLGRSYLVVVFDPDRHTMNNEESWWQDNSIDGKVGYFRSSASEAIGHYQRLADNLERAIVIFDDDNVDEPEKLTPHQMIKKSKLILFSKIEDESHDSGWLVIFGKISRAEFDQRIDTLNQRLRSAIQKRRAAGEDKLSWSERVIVTLSPLWIILIVLLVIVIIPFLLLSLALSSIPNFIKKIRQ
ncbi:MAG: hypothetical protein WCT32_00355 [Patescibacteria group bacterium]|jgi:hypothetical protein